MVIELKKDSTTKGRLELFMNGKRWFNVFDYCQLVLIEEGDLTCGQIITGLKNVNAIIAKDTTYITNPDFRGVVSIPVQWRSGAFHQNTQKLLLRVEVNGIKLD